MKKNTLILIALLGLSACGEDTKPADAYGNFEAEPVTVSAMARGEILDLRISEGQHLEAGALVALIDTTALDLQRQQIQANLEALDQKLRDAAPEIAVLEKQRANLEREIGRVQRLLAARAATPQQLDDLQGQLEVLNQRIEAVSSQTSTANRAILAEKGPLRVQLRQVEKQIRDCYRYNPQAGTVLTQLVRKGEMVMPGGPLYRIAPLDTLTLRAYANATDIQRIQPGSSVEVRIDDGPETYRSLSGRVKWIASEAEFTPQTVQTKEERTSLVYALEVAVVNDGSLRIGQPGEVIFPGGTPEKDNQ